MQSFYLAGLRALRSFHMAQNAYFRSVERISTGLRINRAADDPAGLGISERMRAQIRGLNQASRNAQDGISLLNVADGALQETHAILHRLREIAVYSATGTLTEQERRALQIEFDELVKAIDDIGKNTNFNTIPLLDGSRGEDNPLKLQIGANAGQNTDVSLGNVQAKALGLIDDEGNILSVSTQKEADEAIGKIDDALGKVSDQRAYIDWGENSAVRTHY